MNNALSFLVSMTIGSSMILAGLPVTRSSLLGYDVGIARGLDVGEAAQVLAMWQTMPLCEARPAAARPVVELLDRDARAGLRSVCERDGWTIETWDQGRNASARVSSLRAQLGSHNVREKSERDGRHMIYWTA